jgi:hypothetical protein
MRPEYARAIEQQADWLVWAERQGPPAWRQIGEEAGKNYVRALPFYRDVLRRGETFVMDPAFCDLVDQARRSVPDDLAFDLSWAQTSIGWCWLEEAFRCPTIAPQDDPETDSAIEKIELKGGIRIPAVGWMLLPPGQRITNAATGAVEVVGPQGAIHVATFQDFRNYHDGSVEGFGCWSYISIHDGELLGERVARFEDHQTQGRYRPSFEDRRAHPLHEIRWIYAAFSLMAQRLAATVPVHADRATRRRLEARGAPHPPLVRVVTLRRLTNPTRSTSPHTVAWSCRWPVVGHWRHLASGKRVWIPKFIKGPADRPLRPGALKLFAASR